MKRLCILLLSIAILSGCSSDKRNTIKYIASAAKATKDKKWISYDTKGTTEINGQVTMTAKYSITIHADGSNSFYYFTYNNDTICYKISDCNVLIVNNQNHELTNFTKNDDNIMYYSAKGQYEYLVEYFLYYFVGLPQKMWNEYIPKVTEIVDTVIDGKQSHEYVTEHRNRLLYNHETNEFDIPLQYRSQIWINSETQQIDSVIVQNITENDFTQKYSYYVSNISFDDRSQYLDSIFNFENPKYKSYSRHTESFIPYSMRGTRADTIYSKLFDFPIVNLAGDTTNLNKEEGFILLNFWGFGCPPCMKNLQRYKKQTDSLGYRILEKEGIKIMAINYWSNNMELIAETAEKYDIQDIVYSAKGMGEFIKIPYIGYFYLLSPSKEKIFETGDLGDYSELLKAKANYESSLKN